MDERRFDSLTRVLGAGMNRRQVVRGLAAGAGGGLLAALRAGEVLGKKPKPLKACGKACVMKGGVCCEDGSCRSGDGCCPEEKVCSGGCLAADDCCPYTERECPDGSCAGQGSCCPGIEFPCAADPKGCCDVTNGEQCGAVEGCCNTLVYALCDGRCIDPWADADHCGHCETVCDATEICERGQCVSTCPEGEASCDSACVNSVCAGGTFNPITCDCDCPFGSFECGNACCSDDEVCYDNRGMPGGKQFCCTYGHAALDHCCGATWNSCGDCSLYCCANTAFCCDDGRCIASGINTCNE